MADAGSRQSTPWPLPKFYFTVELGDGKLLRFSEVSGLDGEVQPVEFRQGDSKVFSPIKMPGLRKLGNVTLKKGVVPMDSAFSTWVGQVKGGASERRTIIITLLDESSVPTMAWTLTDALPVKILHTDLKSDAGDIAIETVEVAYETLTVTTP